jgi:hypothetical protein
MDERQQQIRERAGLEESRLNQDFIDFLQKWHPCSARRLVARYALWQRYQKAEDTKIATAFAAVEAARAGDNPSPDTLISVADEHAGRGAVALLARREAADIYLDCAARGVKPGSVVNPDGTLASEDDAVKTPEEREELLKQAAASYQWIVDQTRNDDDKAQHTMGGLYGLAAVAETRGEWDRAKEYYQQVTTIAKRKGYANHEATAQKRLDSLSELAKAEPLPLKIQVPPALEQPKPEVTLTPVDPSQVPPSSMPAPTIPPVRSPGEQPAPAPPTQAPEQPATPPGGG